MLFVRLMAGVLGLLLLGAIAWGFSAAPFWPSVSEIMKNPWGVVTVVDLYVGFGLSSLMIAILEPRKWFAPLWIIPLYFLGNIVLAAWLVTRFSKALTVLAKPENSFD